MASLSVLLLPLASALTCMNQGGQAVEWYVALKSAGQGRTGSNMYAYIDSTSR